MKILSNQKPMVDRPRSGMIASAIDIATTLKHAESCFESLTEFRTWFNSYCEELDDIPALLIEFEKGIPKVKEYLQRRFGC